MYFAATAFASVAFVSTSYSALVLLLLGRPVIPGHRSSMPLFLNERRARAAGLGGRALVRAPAGGAGSGLRASVQLQGLRCVQGPRLGHADAVSAQMQRVRARGDALGMRMHCARVHDDAGRAHPGSRAEDPGICGCARTPS